jgi:hypothetical protein
VTPKGHRALVLAYVPQLGKRVARPGDKEVAVAWRDRERHYVSNVLSKRTCRLTAINIPLHQNNKLLLYIIIIKNSIN